jgi:hypothetical protein
LREYLKGGLLDEMQIHLVPFCSAAVSGSSRISTLRGSNGENEFDRDTGRHPPPIRSGAVIHLIPASLGAIDVKMIVWG